VAGSCDEPSGSGAKELVRRIWKYNIKWNLKHVRY
jgi:hypothetical protein